MKKHFKNKQVVRIYAPKHQLKRYGFKQREKDRKYGSEADLHADVTLKNGDVLSIFIYDYFTIRPMQLIIFYINDVWRYEAIVRNTNRFKQIMKLFGVDPVNSSRFWYQRERNKLYKIFG